MVTLLLIIIFIAFIGLGVPDSLIGAAWPAIYSEMNIPITYANFITLLISICTVFSSFFSCKVISKFGTGIVTAFSTLLTAIGILGFFMSTNFIWLIILSIPLGVGAGAVDTGLNNYVALHYNASQMSFLHCFYGVGVVLSPFLMSLMLAGTEGWRGGYRFSFYIQLGITVLLFITLPLWKKVKFKGEFQSEVLNNKPLKEVIKDPLLIVGWFILIGSCAVEVNIGNWCTTFFVEARNMPVSTAALALTFYYAGMTVGRFLSGILAIKLKPWQIIISGQIIMFSALFVMFFNVSDEILIGCLFFIALGNGPIFPNMSHLTPVHFGREASQAAMGTQMAVAYIGITVMPLIFSFIANNLGLQVFPYFNMAMFAIMALGTITFRMMLKKRNI